MSEEILDPWLHIEHSDQIARMRRLIPVFDEHTCQLEPLGRHRLIKKRPED